VDLALDSQHIRHLSVIECNKVCISFAWKHQQ
jgi:hypothetical protein